MWCRLKKRLQALHEADYASLSSRMCLLFFSSLFTADKAGGKCMHVMRGWCRL
jgi:hypothetical protein